MRKSLRLLVLALAVLPAIAVMPEVGATNSTALERPTLAAAKGAIRSQATTAALTDLRPDVSATFKFLSFKLGPTRSATRADQYVTPGVPRVGASVTQVSGAYEIRLEAPIVVEGESRKYCTTTRMTFWGTRSILYKLSGKWKHTVPLATRKGQNLSQGFC